MHDCYLPTEYPYTHPYAAAARYAALCVLCKGAVTGAVGVGGGTLLPAVSQAATLTCTTRARIENVVKSQSFMVSQSSQERGGLIVKTLRNLKACGSEAMRVKAQGAAYTYGSSRDTHTAAFA